MYYLEKTGEVMRIAVSHFTELIMESLYFTNERI